MTEIAAAWRDGGAPLVLVLMGAAVIIWQNRQMSAKDKKIELLETDIKELYKGSVTLLEARRNRDEEELRAYREQERRRLESRISTPAS